VFFYIKGIMFTIIVLLHWCHFVLIKYVNWLLSTIIVIDLVFVNWALLSICVRFVLAFVCNCSDRVDILELSLPLFCVHFFSYCIWFSLHVCSTKQCSDKFYKIVSRCAFLHYNLQLQLFECAFFFLYFFSP
jgi:hypothetical protein